MKVGHLVASASRIASGYFHSVRNLAIYTQKLGVEVTAFALRDEFTEADLPAWGAVPVRIHSVLGLHSFGFAPGLVRSIQNAGLDLLHVHDLWAYPSMASLRLHRSGKLAYVVSPHGMLDPWAVRNSAWKKKIASFFYGTAHLRSASCLRALCESEAAAMRALGLRNAICLIPNGQELPADAVREQACNGLGFARGRKVLLFLGRLHPKKGLPNLLRAWANCQKGEPDAANWALVVAGGDQNGHARVLSRMALELGIQDSVSLTGPLFSQEKAQAFQRAEAFVVPSLSEGLPNAILEAWAWRLPVLMTPQCNLPEGFAEGAAIRVEPSVESLTEGLRALFRMSDSDREEIGARGRCLVERRFSWPVLAEQMVGVYRWVLAGGPKPDCVRLG
jgi:poly(glycerol-phosphate) alpha-glucosyltransferase